MYEVINARTRLVVGRAKTLKGALRTIDRLDNAYGAAVHIYRRIHNVH